MNDMKKLVQRAVLVCGIVFMAVGVYRGEMDIVLQQAINICLECIGIG